ncbi:MAG: flagellar basal body P-ring formation chaperone FlgA [Alphaproteobacteria bacterium]|nr:flagellar basal body P-ring formation chaperone FlgA [Alphaproteobacteria bacterium]
MRKLLFAVSLALSGAAQADTLVTAETIATRISQAIAARLPTDGRYMVTLPDPSYQLALPAPAQGRFDIPALTFDPAHQSFLATLAYTGQSGATEYVRIGGSALAVIDVPAPARDIAAGEMISDGDLTTIEIPVQRSSAALLTSNAGIVGQSARRALRARTPLFAYDVKKPVLVKKGELVAVIYSLPGIELSAQGQAQADAAKGDTVSVINTTSRRTVEARVTGPGTVSVAAPGNTLAALQ